MTNLSLHELRKSRAAGVSLGIPRDRQLCPRHCGKIEALKECGLGEHNIAKTVGVSRGSVNTCLKRLAAGAISCKKSSRRPRKTCDGDDRFPEVHYSKEKSPFDIAPAKTRLRGEHGTSCFQIFSLSSTGEDRNARPLPSQEAC